MRTSDFVPSISLQLYKLQLTNPPITIPIYISIFTFYFFFKKGPEGLSF